MQTSAECLQRNRDLVAVAQRMDDLQYPCYIDLDEDEWALEMANSLLEQGKTIEQVANSVLDAWEPSDDLLISHNPVGTAWHDGCR